MREDFVSRLETQLFEAAEREERRGRGARAIRSARWNATSAPVLAACGLLLALVIAIAAALALRGDEPPPASDPRVVERTQLVQTGGVVVRGFGSVWAVDQGAGQVLRVDPRTRRILARIPVGQQARITVAEEAVWALVARRLLRIDPDTNRVTARIPLGTTAGGAGDVLPGRGVVWVPSNTEFLRVDPRGERVDKRVPVAADGFLAYNATSDGETLYIGRADDSMLRLDARTGAEVPGKRPAVPGFFFAAADGLVFLGNDQGVGAFDPDSGQVLWSRRLPLRTINNATIANGLVWVHGTNGRTGRDRLWRLDARTGAMRGSVALREFGAPGLAPVGNEVWVVSGSGVLTVVR
jgi:outer membrane protein assembly factor BamB